MAVVVVGVVQAQDIPGGWSDWRDAGPCCDGRKAQVRSCTNPPPSGQGAFCAGPSRLTFTCAPEACTNGGWGDWTEYGPCCYGQKRRTRECLAAREDFCQGPALEWQQCGRAGGLEECWTPNLVTGKCAVQELERVDPDNTYELVEDCCQLNFATNYDFCLGSEEDPVDGGWGEWNEYGLCCYGSQSRYRACNNPAPANGGKRCEGSFSEERPCSIDQCSGVDTQRDISTSSSSSYRKQTLLAFAVILLAL